MKFSGDKFVFALLIQIAERVERDLPDYPDNRMTLVMDLEAYHSNGCPLDLNALLAAKPGDFAHDIYGIRRHVDREECRPGGCFMPRFALDQGAQS